MNHARLRKWLATAKGNWLLTMECKEVEALVADYDRAILLLTEASAALVSRSTTPAQADRIVAQTLGMVPTEAFQRRSV